MLLRLLIAILASWLVAGSAHARGLTLGLSDGVFTTAEADQWFERAADARAEVVRISVDWHGIAARRPARPTDPDDPAYAWGRLDAAAAAAHARGLQVLLTISGAPDWAEGSHRPRSAPVGTWKPSARATGQFATALARRYVTQAQYVQVFNEPNLSTYLTPQWIRRGGRYRSFAPSRYRAMLNAAYPGVHAAGLRLVTAGTAPYGDPGRGGNRTMPVAFWRAVLRKETRFDVFAHHPYAVRGPSRRALNRDDVAVPDVHKLTALVRAARRAGKVSASAARHTWVTEISWDSKPPDPLGVPERKQARWLADAMRILYDQGVETVIWFQIRDQAPDPSYAETNQSGLYLRSGKAKLAQRAFAFPFSCVREGARTRVWLKAPVAGPVDIRRGDAVVGRLQAGSSRVASKTIGATGTLRAISGTERSLTCRS